MIVGICLPVSLHHCGLDRFRACFLGYECAQSEPYHGHGVAAVAVEGGGLGEGRSHGVAKARDTSELFVLQLQMFYSLFSRLRRLCNR